MAEKNQQSRISLSFSPKRAEGHAALSSMFKTHIMNSGASVSIVSRRRFDEGIKLSAGRLWGEGIFGLGIGCKAATNLKLNSI